MDTKMFQYDMRRDFVSRYLRGWKEHRNTPAEVARIVSQDYEVIKKEWLAQGVLWEDPNFPANDKSLFPNGKPRKEIKWLRPKDICTDPQMSVDGFTRFDVKQGALHNCWFLAAMASLCATENKDLFHRVVPKDNVFDRESYAGVFHFKIWQYGQWRDVVIDDQLPTVEGRLFFARSATQNEFWPALLEKAYAKLNGSYEALDSGSTSEAMQDFTGGVTESFDLHGDNVRSDLFKIMSKAFQRDSLMGCSVDHEHSNSECRFDNGLVASHAYSITWVEQITTVRGRNVNLIRVRNPWANDVEWKGAWSDGSPEWDDMSEEDKESLGLTFEKDGEFWISFEDFQKNFSKLELCMTVLAFDVMNESVVRRKQQWEMTQHEGSWKKFLNAGGCRNHIDTFWTNPQYKVQVVDPDEGDDDNTGTLIVALMQKDRRKKIEGLESEMLTIGYYIHAIPDSNVGSQDSEFFKENAAVASSPKFIDVREVVGRHKLAPGNYLIVPCTFDPNEEGDFLLRIFSEKPAESAEIDEPTRFVVKMDIKLSVTEKDEDEERDLQELFRQTAGSDLEVDAYELRSILDAKLKSEFKIEGVSLETARSMVAMMDIDHSGKLGYNEFKNLWTDLRHWKDVFRQYDVSRTNSLSTFEMRAALKSTGFLVSNHTLNCLVMRYSDQKGFVRFDDFLLCVTRLRTMFEVFQPAVGAEVAAFSLDQIIQTTMYA